MNTDRDGAVAAQLPETGPSPISFVGAGPLTDSSEPLSVVTLSVPVGVRSGDIMLAQLLVYDGSGTNVPVAPAGWSLIRHDSVTGNGDQMTSWLYSRVAGSDEPATYGWGITLQFAAGVIRAWRGASLTTPIDRSSGATGSGANPLSLAAPSLTPATNSELQVYLYAAQNFLPPTITEPAQITQRLNSKSPEEGFTLAFGDLAAPSEGTASPTYVAMASSSTSGAPVMSAEAVLLVPAGIIVVTPTPTATPTVTPTSTATATAA